VSVNADVTVFLASRLELANIAETHLSLPQPARNTSPPARWLSRRRDHRTKFSRWTNWHYSAKISFTA